MALETHLSLLKAAPEIILVLLLCFDELRNYPHHQIMFYWERQSMLVKEPLKVNIG